MHDIHSPKSNNVGRSIEKKLFHHEKSDKKLIPNSKGMNSTQNLQNVSLRNLDNTAEKKLQSPSPTHAGHNITAGTISKEDRKHISKLLIAQVHFCRFLYKLLGRIK